MMHRLSWTILRGVKQGCDPILRQLYTPAYIENETQLPFVVGWILMNASGSNGTPDGRLLAAAAESIDVAVDVGYGKMAIMAARQIGHDIEFREDGEDVGESSSLTA